MGDGVTDGGCQLTNSPARGLSRCQDNPADDRAPAISPDNLRVVFSSGRGGERAAFELWVMNLDGSNLRKLTDTGTSNLYASFEP